MNKPWVRWLLLLLAASPALLPLYMILRWGVDFPYWDQWEVNFGGMYVHAHQGTLKFADIAAQHNEHRMLFPRLVFLIVNTLTHWNVIFELFVQWLIVLATSVMVLWLYHVNERDSVQTKMPAFLSLEAIVLWFLANLLIFSPTQVENTLWGIGIANVMPMLFVVPAIIAARCRLGIWPRTILVILFCSAATFTSGSGVVSWALAGLVLLWAQTWEELKSRKWIVVALIGAIIVNTVLYFSDYVTPDRGSQTYSAPGFGAIVQYFFIYTGTIYACVSQFTFNANATTAGAIMFVLYLACAAYVAIRWRDAELCRRMIVWHAIAGYALLCGVLTSLSRSGMGVVSALSSRYVAYSLYLPVGLIYLIQLITTDLARRWRGGEAIRLSAPMFAVLLLVGWLEPIPKMLEISQSIYVGHRTGKAAMLFVKVLPENPLIAQAVYPFPFRVKEFAPVLSEMGYLRPRLIETTNALLLKDPDAGGDFVVGSIENSYQTGDNNIAMTGSAIFPSLHRPADTVLLCFNNDRGEPTIFAMAPSALDRPDRASALGDTAYRYCGWAVECPVAEFPPSPKSIVITVWAFDADTGHAYPLQGSTTINR